MAGLSAWLQTGVASTLVFACTLAAGAAGAAKIYTCTDPVSGKKLTSDRPIPECNAVTQRILNSDGSVNKSVPPTLTVDERAAEETRELDEKRRRVIQQDAVRRDRNLLVRFPNDAVHLKAREAALEEPRKSLQRSQARIVVLAKERKPLDDDAEFYKGRQMPAQLKRQLDANDASVQAQQDLVQNAQNEIVRLNALYDVELERLKLLWAGAQAGSLGAIPAPAAASAPRRAASTAASK
jgi:hypothetical protein